MDVYYHTSMFNRVLNTAKYVNENCLNIQSLVQVSLQNQQLKQSKTNAFIAFLIFLEATVAI